MQLAQLGIEEMTTQCRKESVNARQKSSFSDKKSMAEAKPQPEESAKDQRFDYTESVVWDDMPGPYKRLAQNLYRATACKYIYLGILAANCGLAVWIIIDSVSETFPHPIFYVFEFLVNLTLMVDVGIRIWLNGWYRFWHMPGNVFELVLVSICFILTILTIAGTTAVTIRPSDRQRGERRPDRLAHRHCPHGAAVCCAVRADRVHRDEAAAEHRISCGAKAG